MELPNKKYQIVYADPAWQTGYLKEKKKGIDAYDLPYNSMSLNEVKALPIKDILNEDAILFIWIIDKYIPYIKDIMESWGFEYKTLGFVWHKKALTTKGENAIMSPYGHKSVELCFVGTRGKYLVKNPTIKQFLSTPKREHSRKPDEIRTRIVKICGDIPRIELFARQRFQGWDVWGNEVPTECQNVLTEVSGNSSHD